MLELETLFSDETEFFRLPMEADPDDNVMIRFRTAAENAERVFLIHEDQWIGMYKESTRAGFDYYSVQIRVGSEPYSYLFAVQQGSDTCYYAKCGASWEPDRIHPFTIFPGFHTPDWAKGAVMYQIFTDRFCNGDRTNDVLTDEYAYLDSHVQRVGDWNTPPDGKMDVSRFYGGDLQGVLDKLDYLKELGIEVIYFNPLFVSPSNHKYDAQDYDYIDPHLGRIEEDGGALLPKDEMDNTHATKYIIRVTEKKNLEASNELFVRLVEEAHARGIRVILDGVFNHCGSFHKWMDAQCIYEGRHRYAKGAYVSEDSPYREFFQFEEDSRWPYNGHYDGWWGHKTLPKLNYEASLKLEEEILRIGRKWVSPPYNADGWRLDVAADLGHSPEFNHQFWKKFRAEVKRANPDALILAEHYGDPDAWLQGDEWDTVMNYDAFMEPVSWFLTGMEKHSDSSDDELYGNAESFRYAMAQHMAAYPMPSLLTSMNELDNHDHSRFLTRTNRVVGRVQDLGPEAAEKDVDKAVLREAVVMQMTWPGAPTVYYGDEAGLCGFTDPDDRRPFPWGREDRELQAFYRAAIAMHKEYPVLRTGSTIILYQDRHVLGYARFDDREQILVFVNNRKEAYELEAQIWPAGIDRTEKRTYFREVFASTAQGFSVDSKSQEAAYGKLYLQMEPQSAVVLHCRRRSRQHTE